MKLTVLLLCAATAFAQLPPRQNVTVALTNAPTAATVQEMTGLVKNVAQVYDASYDEAHHSYSLTGFEHQLGLAAWLLHATEKPADSNEYAMQPDLPADNRNLVTRVHYLRNSDRANYLEILTIARSVGEIWLTSGGSEPAMIAFRGTASEAELGDWLATNLDVPAGTGYNTFTLPARADGTEDVVRIFFLKPGMSLHDILDLRDKIRLRINTKTIFNKTSPPAIVIRGTSSVLSQAQELISRN
jgi:hypothetical protein